MKSLMQKLAIAVLLSFSCAAGTLFWYFRETKQNSASSTPLVAQAAEVNNEVLRRPAARLLWESVNTGDDLHDGETIRTSENGDLRIRFDDGRYIELEPESLVVLQKSERAISLDLLEGSLFVDAKAVNGDADSLVLKSGNKSVDLSGAKASLSRGAGNRLDVEVLEGSAKLKDTGGKARELKKGEQSSLGSTQTSTTRIEILSPSTQQPHFLHSNSGNKVRFRWKGLDPSWKVQLLVGPTRRQMKALVENDPEQADTAIAAVPYGKHWFSLVARSRTSDEVMQTSVAYRIEVRGRPPVLLSAPANDTVVAVDKAPAQVEFKWQQQPGAKMVQLKVGSDPLLTKMVFAKELSGNEGILSPDLAEGVYFARVVTHYPEFPEPELSPLYKFSVRVRAVIAKPPARITWTIPESRHVQVFGLTPELELSWRPEARTDEIVGYRLRLKRVKDDSVEKSDEEALRQSFKEPMAKAKLLQAGRYLASVEGVDQYEHVVGQSEAIEVTSIEAPLLPAPLLLPKEDPIRSGSDGRIELKWQPLEGAKEYQLVITNKSGRELFNKRLTTTLVPFKNLMPGSYSVKLDAYDQWGRMSQPSAARTLVVPDKSGLKAPTVKRIKVD